MARQLKILLPVLIVFAVLAAGYIISNALNDDDAGTSDAQARATAEKDAKEASATPKASRTPKPSATATRTGSSSTDGELRDLEADEDAGGHTLARHVGKSDAELKDRLKRDAEISAASTFTDQDTAERTVGAILAKNTKKISDWTREGSDRQNLVLRGTMGDIIGRSLKRSASKPVDVKAAVVVLRADGRDWYVLTSYPEER